MANPFTGFAFPASGSGVNTNRTMPDRIADIHNVKDFGAVGDGVTDDLAAINAAINWTSGSNRGTIFFPPGTYLVSGPISLTGGIVIQNSVTVHCLGVLGLSTITGNFADYILSQATPANSNLNVIEKLTIVNTNAAGGGIRLGGTVGGAIRDCTITANKCINTNTNSSPAALGSLEISIENCRLNAGSNYTNSIGISTVSDGPILACTFTNLSIGLEMAGGEGSCFVAGCQFNQCGTAILPGGEEDGTFFSNSGTIVIGCSFTNNSTAISFQTSTGDAIFSGLNITGAAGQAPGSTDPQYGILDGSGGSSDHLGYTLLSGINITGTYDIKGIYLYGNTNLGNSLVVATSSVSWQFDTQSGSNAVMPNVAANCNGGSGLPYIYTVGHLPGAIEGDCYNVSDGTNSLTWGAMVTNTGTHTTHYKVRYNGSNYTVVGQ